MSVLLIQNPPFTVDFSQTEIPSSAPKGLCQKVDETARYILSQMVLILKAALESFYVNARYSWSTFKYLVLGFNGREFTNPPQSAEAFLCRLSVWAIAHTVGVIIFSILLYVQKSRAHVQSLEQFASKKIHLNHFATKKTEIDVSKVPATIQVSKLLELFDKINFTDPKMAGYMPESSRREGGKVFSKHELRRHLEVCVRNIQSRTPFIGTPPAYMAPQLMRFYEQIEKALRYSLHKVTERQDVFLRKHGGKIPQQTDPGYQTYKNMLEDQARIAIDMAIAGAHCGARYMSDAMDTYLSLQENAENQFDTFQDHLKKLLANKREKIARAHIEQYMGTDAHAFSSYMANMGTLLGIPGTENVIEYLGGRFFNKSLMLQRFFSVYTPQSIKETLQETIKTSQSFRELLFDWLKDQSRDWNKEYYKQITDSVMTRIENQKPDSQKGFHQNIDRFLELCQSNKETKLPDPKNDFDSYLDALFILDTTREKYDIFERQRLKMALKNDFIKNELIQAALGSDSAAATLKEKAYMLDTIDLINQVLNDAEMPSVDTAVLLRCHQDKKALKEILDAHIDQMRKSEFLQKLTGDDASDTESAKVLEKKGVPPKVLDWILIRNQVLYA